MNMLICFHTSFLLLINVIQYDYAKSEWQKSEVEELFNRYQREHRNEQRRIMLDNNTRSNNSQNPTISNKSVIQDTAVKRAMIEKKEEAVSSSSLVMITVATGCSVAGLVGVIIAVVCWYRLQKSVKDASDVEYPAYGAPNGSTKEMGSPGDRKLAHSAQMYHYQHQKQQMIAMEIAKNDLKDNGTDDDSEEENEEGDYTVYECPGLAPTGEMEVKNPLFSEETPVTPTTEAVMK